MSNNKLTANTEEPSLSGELNIACVGQPKKQRMGSESANPEALGTKEDSFRSRMEKLADDVDVLYVAREQLKKDVLGLRMAIFRTTREIQFAEGQQDLLQKELQKLQDSTLG